MSKVQRSRNWGEASEGVLLVDDNWIAVGEGQVALNALKVGLEEEGGGEEGIVYIEWGAIKESCDALRAGKRNDCIEVASRCIVGELDGGGWESGSGSNSSGEESNRESDDGLHFDWWRRLIWLFG